MVAHELIHSFVLQLWRVSFILTAGHVVEFGDV